MKRAFTVVRGGLQDRFIQSRKKIQIYGGGFANGKTSGAVIKALQLAREYPGSNGLIARSTYPKLNDTIRAEFVKWCPKHWIKSFPRSKNSDNTCTMQNGTTVNFRYIQQQGKRAEGSTSNLLSANYDWIIVDQIEDPEIVKKDFDDLLGRLRGSAEYIGEDPTMPESGPRWMIITLNPTRNWFYKEVIRPYHMWMQDGRAHEGLLIEYEEDEFGAPLLNADGNPIPKLDEAGRVIPIIDLIEGSTYENKQNLPADYIRTLEATYKGVMRERFLLGKWAAYEGLVYPMYDDSVHSVPRHLMKAYWDKLRANGYECAIVESYDHGMIAPSCYEFGFTDPLGNVHVVDGFYEAELSPERAIEKIKQIRQYWLGIPPHDTKAHMRLEVLADPGIFRRGGTSEKAVVGRTIADIMHDGGDGILMRRANNNIINGVVKVQSYLTFCEGHMNPYTDQMHEYHEGDTVKLGAPHLYVAKELAWFDGEITEYYWDKNTNGAHIDKPKDGNDHAMDAVKYLLTRRPPIAKIVPSLLPQIPGYMRWHETEAAPTKSHRYAA